VRGQTVVHTQHKCTVSVLKTHDERLHMLISLNAFIMCSRTWWSVLLFSGTPPYRHTL